MPLTPKQRRSLNLGIETAVVVILITVYFEPDPTIFLDPIRIFLNIVILFFISGLIAPLLYVRETSELSKVISIMFVFYIHAIILYLASIILFSIPLEDFLSPYYLLIIALSAPITTFIWLGVYSIFIKLRSGSSDEETDLPEEEKANT